MGWTFHNEKKTLAQFRDNHVREATQYRDKIARIIMHEWHPHTWYALIGFYDTPDSTQPNHVFLRTDMIDSGGEYGQFGYKDMEESYGPYLEDKPTKGMADTIYKYIPEVYGYAGEFRDRMGIKYDSLVREPA